MDCVGCGTVLSSSARFCRTCGVPAYAGAAPANSQAHTATLPPRTDLDGPQWSSHGAGDHPWTGKPGGAGLPRPPGWDRVRRWVIAAADALTRAVRSRSRRFWIRAGIAAGAVGVLLIGGLVTLSAVAAAHQPQVAAINFLRARAARAVPAMLNNAVVVPPSDTNGADVLLSKADISSELAGAANDTGAVSHIRVVRSSTSGDVAAVDLQYVARGQAYTATYQLVKAATASGWAVQVAARSVNISVPQAGEPVTVAGIAVTPRGNRVTVAVYPATMTVATAGTPEFRAERQTVDTLSGSADVSLPAELTAKGATAATQAVAAVIGHCVAASSLAPANCPNGDNPYPCSAGDQCTGVQWSVQPGWMSALRASVASGRVMVAGSITATDTYMDTTPGLFGGGPSSTQQTDGPTTWDYQYAVSYDGAKWTVGDVQTQPSY